ncbi:hypothetical protein [Erythrobacter sp. EC-HK427]|nr:hypothetical protein [Erythrobacter sp. EC-HK427]
MLTAIAAAATLSGCASIAPSANVGGPFAGAEGMVSARNYLLPSQHAAALTDEGIRAFILLDNDDFGRNRKICRAFERLPDAGLYEEIGMGDQVAPVHWPLVRPISEDLTGDARCNALIENYSWPIGTVVYRMANLPRPSTVYLVAMDGRDSFYFDIDDGSQAQLDQIFLGWHEYAALNQGQAGTTLKDRITQIVEAICGSGMYDILMSRLPEGRLVSDVVGIAYRDGECAAALTYAEGPAVPTVGPVS